ncbi:hypothetical protein ACOMHN_061321 [Nucella lapillus]
MAPRTDNPSPPMNFEHLCQAAETGRWTLVKESLYPNGGTLDTNNVSQDHESQLISTALQQGRWDFLQLYAGQGCCRFPQHFTNILMSAVDVGMHCFVSSTICCFQYRYQISSTWLVDMLKVFLTDDRHLQEALDIAKELPDDVSVEDVRSLISIVERLETHHTMDRDKLLRELFDILDIA